MPYSPQTYEEKPYNRCIDCVHIGKNCDGPDFLAMSIPRLCEWSRLRKAFLNSRDSKWTNSYIAAAADISKTTVDHFFSGDIDDIKFSTAARIIKVLVDGTWGQYPCAFAAGETNPDLEAECSRLKAQLEDNRQKIDHLKEQVDFRGDQMRAKDEQLKERKKFLELKDKTIQLLAALLGVCLVIIIGSMLVDIINPDVGYFWLR